MFNGLPSHRPRLGSGTAQPQGDRIDFRLVMLAAAVSTVPPRNGPVKADD